MSQPMRPRFIPSRCDGTEVDGPLAFEGGDPHWLPLVWCPADFPIELFEVAVSQLIHHPEYNSTLILRSNMLSDTTADFPPSVPLLRDLIPTRNVCRKLLPRRPGRDAGLEQHCTLYTSAHGDPSPSTLVLTPLVEPGSSLPYYHPTVTHLAFRYILTDPPVLRIEVVPLPSTPTDVNSRIYRTCLALLETLHRYGWGAMTNYKKRVLHDCIIPREPYQDLYLVMRERHKHVVDTWHEVTDPSKHVFEDIGIATFLMLLWKDMYNTDESSRGSGQVAYESEPWRSWPRPLNGFLDLGCGNGLLVHILTAEGYLGHGIDLRARTSWSHYPDTTQSQLHVEALDPTIFADPAVSELPPYLRAGTFIIGNHADELTPWVPVLSTLCSASGYLSIPCCAWTFDARYERSSTPPYPVPDANFVENLNLGGDGSNKSSYSMYRIWLASLSLHCGWKVECETLRIPSTRNWAIIGRKTAYGSTEEADKVRQRVEQIVQFVCERGIFRTRRPEGRAGDH
ncbi:tRNA (uracil-O(2)-)-methyltransferase [Sparassis crispa]|uniref:tRNA (uracil-O(2)-)-methyltransferase n=1 Tax=Sparassis crispa TaxID=139825 RepID=A0A401G6T3_9APHY|nr:tRNA (uracil-O(2)-)-methyltransferase [Sparassis crispa]GBE77881.1 tRNA (uracil-O(2)-)-methyltransferase [Sparassis crispa]